jgi:hypothetical protein
VPIVDSAMRCLSKTGMMHNRLRMVVASFFDQGFAGGLEVGGKAFCAFSG